MAQDPNDRTLVERVDPLLGSVLDRRYRIDFRIAAGGFGAIYRATHVKSGHQVALKVLHPQLAADAGVVARFRREGAALTTLRSPHTITAYELGEAPDGTLYIVMELLRGESLFERYRARGPFEWKRMAAIARAVCSSLEEAHALGIVHRDLKPTNINLEDKDGNSEFVKVLDFGIAKILRDSDFDSSDLTHAGQMIGTLDYMAPEQMVGGACTGQSDIYVLGIVMYEMISGCRPFEQTSTPSSALAAMLRNKPTALSSRVPVPDELDAIVMRCLEREPQNRYPDVVALGADLDRLLEGGEASEVTQTLTVADDEVTRTVEVEDLDSQDRTLFSIAPSPERATRPISQPAVVPARRPATDGPGTPAVVRTPVRQPSPQAIAPDRGPQPMPSTPGATPATLAGNTPTPRFERGAFESPRFPPTPAPAPAPAPFARATPTPPPSPSLGTPGYPPVRPPTPIPGYGPPPGAAMPYAPTPPRGSQSPGFDMANVAARDAAMRRFVWIAVLVGGALIGVIVASQL